MFVSLLLGLALLLVLGLALRGFVSVEPRQLMRIGRWLLLALGGCVFIYLALSGRLSLAIGAGFLLLPFLGRLWRGLDLAAVFNRLGGNGGASQLETKSLKMSLDHATGDLDGEVLIGAYAGRRLSDLSFDEVIDLFRLCATVDSASVALLESFLDQRWPDWRETHAASAAGGHAGADDRTGTTAAAAEAGGPMTAEQARRILGLDAGASEDDIRAAYHRLIALVHPDRGGSGFLAAQVNRARDILLGSSHRG
ncbi:MAG: hypothetical protein U1E42_11605 [Rhodospirillales bacterium]